ncbi:E3 ubiquitin-protein ligase makorin-2-like [Anopheles marshallii]|uniref:E3 ubiquitin-protein ligase makorin-2-like n=1 Tax=Anopheles marshallii TaxID=1521116 RepID=UPI00237B27F9|nr:E3 ubiquitin-protein ligase makorin-2-like [Anopheles marshallii]
MENKSVPTAPLETLRGASEKIEAEHCEHGTCLFGSSSQSTATDVIETQDSNTVGNITPGSGKTAEVLPDTNSSISELSSTYDTLRLMPNANHSDHRVDDADNHVDTEAEEELSDDEDDAVGDGSSVSSTSESSSIATDEELEQQEGFLLPCKDTDPNCPFYECDIHKEQCDLCHKHCLVPGDTEERRIHALECAKLHNTLLKCVAEVELSRGKTCGICMEVVMDKRPREQRFGILPMCPHIFCIKCIRIWRKSDNAKRAKRSCPMCRVVSKFVCPSFLWVEDNEAKATLIKAYKAGCKQILCKYFKADKKCPFMKTCFYKHATA